MITDKEIKQFEEQGAVTIDSPFTPQELNGISAAFDRIMPFEQPEAGQPPKYRQARRYFLEPELVDVIQHPFLEEVAKRTLKSEGVHFWNSTAIVSHPEPDTTFSFSEHVDVRYSTADMRSTPKRMLCSCLLWVHDVNEKRAPLMHRPGSHLMIAEEMDREKEALTDPNSFRRVPDLPYADPVPLTAKAGQVTVCTTAMVHGPSTNVDTFPRKVLFVVFEPDGFEVFNVQKGIEDRLQYYRDLRKQLRPDRLDILKHAD